MLINGCGLLPSPSANSIDTNLPTVESIRTLSDVNEIALEWTPVKSDKIKGYYIYRSNPSKNSTRLEHIATIKDKYTSHYLDTNLQPNTNYSYSMSTFSSSSIESKPGGLVSASTRARLKPVAFVQVISDLPNRIKIIWQPHPNISVDSYEVQRKRPNEQGWASACYAKGRLSAECMDKGLDNAQEYQYRVLAKTNKGVYTQPSNVMSAKTRSLPPVVLGVRASLHVPKAIDISWERSQDEDVVSYNVYSSPTSVLLFTKLANTKDTKYTDLINSNGQTKYYKVTAVDSLGMESKKQDKPAKGSTLPSPKTPTITNVRSQSDGVLVSWTKSVGEGGKYNLYKTFNSSVTKIKNIKNNFYIDKQVVPGVEYEYEVIAVDKYGLESDKSDAAEVEIKDNLR